MLGTCAVWKVYRSAMDSVADSERQVKALISPSLLKDVSFVYDPDFDLGFTDWLSDKPTLEIQLH